MPTIEQQIYELKAAGWMPIKRYIWRSPQGALFLGPHGAWKIMQALGEISRQEAYVS